MEVRSDIAPTQVVAHLLHVSRSKDLEELLEFAHTLSVAPGFVGNTNYEVQLAIEKIEQGIVPQVLLQWYCLVRPDA